MRDKLMPSVNYLQRLGPEHHDLIFEHSRWVFEQDTDIAFEVCSPPSISPALHSTNVIVDIYFRGGGASATICSGLPGDVGPSHLRTLC